MEVCYRLAPLEGSYRLTLVFWAESLNDSTSFRFEEGALENFVSAMAMHNGVWHMQDSTWALQVRLVPGDGSASSNKLMLFDRVFTPTRMWLVPLECEGEGNAERPVGADVLVSAAALAIQYGNQFFHQNIEAWEAEEFATHEIIRAVVDELTAETAPWRGFLFIHPQDMVKPCDDEGCTELLARQWMFVDGSIAYLTASGLMNEVEFQEFLQNDPDIPTFDPDLGNYEFISKAVH